MKELSSRNYSRLTIALIIAHLIIALPLAYHLNIWVDEASSLYATQRGFLVAFQTAATEQKQAPLYFWVLCFWRMINDSIFFARLLSVIFSVVSIKLFAGLTLRLFSKPQAFFLTSFFALHPFLVWSSIEIRVYSAVILLSVILIRLFLAAFWSESAENTNTTNDRWWFLIAAIVALYSNYYLGFLLVGFFCALLSARKYKAAGVYLAMMAVTAVAFLPLVFGVMSEFLSKTSVYQETRTLPEGLRILWNHALTFVLPTEIFPGTDQTRVSMIRLWLIRGLIGIAAIFAVIYLKRIRLQTAAFCVLVLATAAFLLGAYFLIGSSYVEIRHAAVIFVAFILACAMFLRDMLENRNPVLMRPILIAGVLLISGSFAYALVNMYPTMTKRGDWSRVAQFIQENESEGQPIIIFTTFESLALPYYYKGQNKILPDKNYFTFGLEDKFGSPNSLKSEIDFVISEIPADADRIWLVMSDKCRLTEVCHPLENYVHANYTIEKEKEFYLEKLFLLRKKAQ